MLDVYFVNYKTRIVIAVGSQEFELTFVQLISFLALQKIPSEMTKQYENKGK